MEVVGDAKKSVAIIQRVLPPNNLAVMKHLILFLKELAKCSKKTRQVARFSQLLHHPSSAPFHTSVSTSLSVPSENDSCARSHDHMCF